MLARSGAIMLARQALAGARLAAARSPPALGQVARSPLARFATRSSAAARRSVGVSGVAFAALKQARWSASVASAANASSAAAGSTVAIERWLYGCAATVYGMIVLGGVTRLTESGLSMTHWSLAGERLPRSAAEWEDEFARYRDSPEYEMFACRGKCVGDCVLTVAACVCVWLRCSLNRGMSVDEFKRIFYFEYSHRMLGRFIGLAFAAPLAYFWMRGRLTGALKRRLTAILLMIGGQGLLGWYMVRSGLRGQYDPSKGAPPRVSQYRLAAHLSSALAIYATMLWTAMGLTWPEAYSNVALTARSAGRLRAGALVLLGTVATTIVSGAFVAGLDAGLVYNEFPLMGGRLVAEDAFSKPTLWQNVFEHDVTVQFDHRLLALASTLAVGHVWGVSRRMALPPRTRLAVRAVLGALAAQVTLGISALLWFVPVSLGAMHQAGSVALLSSILFLLKEARRLPK